METDVDVVVVGLGPVGAALAALLEQSGLSVLAVEREPQVYPLPRAAHFDGEVMRIFQQLGVAEAVLAHTRPVPDYVFKAADGGVLMRFPAQAPGDGWRSGYMFHQPGLELALRDRLAASARVTVRIGEQFTGFIQDDDGVTVALEGPDGARSVRARYLVGCDGASSSVRAAMGAGLFDYGFDEPWLVIDVKVGEDARLPDVNLQLCDPARPTTCVLMGPGRHRWEFMLKPGETAEMVLGDAFLLPLLAEWDCGDIQIERRAVYRFHGLVAQRWRSGRVLLAGDSAHQTPPFAGQGMCAGMRDAANLAWKLAAVLRGEARADLLDTYQSEREPHVRSYIELAIGMGRVVCTLDPEAAAARDAAMRDPAKAAELPSLAPPAPGPGHLMTGAPGAATLFPQPFADGVGLDDVLGDDAWLIAEAPPAAAGVTAVALSDPRLGPYRARLEAWLTRHSAPAVLVRPDRYVFGTGAPAELVAAWDAYRPAAA